MVWAWGWKWREAGGSQLCFGSRAMLPLLLEDTQGGRKEKKEPLGDEPEARSREWERLVPPSKGWNGKEPGALQSLGRKWAPKCRAWGPWGPSRVHLRGSCLLLSEMGTQAPVQGLARTDLSGGINIIGFLYWLTLFLIIHVSVINTAGAQQRGEVLLSINNRNSQGHVLGPCHTAASGFHLGCAPVLLGPVPSPCHCVSCLVRPMPSPSSWFIFWVCPLS